MALSLDGMAVLGKISANAKVFAGIKADAAKQARALVVKQLKAKGMGVDGLRAVKKALGPNPFNLILDGLSDAEVRSLLNKLDKYQPELKTSNAAWRRDHLRDLAAGKAKPMERPARASAAKPKRPTKPKAAETLDLKSMRTRPKRR